MTAARNEAIYLMAKAIHLRDSTDAQAEARAAFNALLSAPEAILLELAGELFCNTAYFFIPHAQHKALMAAAADVFDWAAKYDNPDCRCADCLCRREIVAALRAAGI
jgi:hypothetical protein